jgi:uncharacterized repeat protein (TIGR02543 family)
MKRGKIKKTRPPEVVTITKECAPLARPSSFIIVRRSVLAVLAIMATVLSINTIGTFAITHAVSLYAADTWNNTEFDDDTITVRSSGKIKLPIPVRYEHTFAGWYRDADFTLPFNPATDRIKRNTTLHARFEPNEYEITFIDTRAYLNTDGTLNANYEPVVYKLSLGMHFTFPAIVGVTDQDGFMGWSHSMMTEQYLNTNDGAGNKQTNIVARPGTHYRNFVRQSATYWTAWEICPTREILGNLPTLGTNVYVNFNFLTVPTEIGRAFPTFAFTDARREQDKGGLTPNNTLPIAPPEDEAVFFSPLPITMPSAFHMRGGDLAFYTALNGGMTSYTFGGWTTPVTGDRIFRDGEAINLSTLNLTVNSVTFYAVWIETVK